MNDHPVRLVLQDDLRRSRLTVFFRLLLAIPHLVWIFIWAIGVVFAVVAAWLAGIVVGRVPRGLHRFLAAYVRYLVHVTAYVSLTANPFPSFTGEPGYPVDVELPEPAQQRRWTIALRFLLALPASLLAAVVGWGVYSGGGSATQGDGTAEGSFAFLPLGGTLAACAVLGWFAALGLGREPNGLRDLGAYGIGYGAQTWAYFLLLTDRYPRSSPDGIGPEWGLPEHEVSLALNDDGRRSRLTVFFRFLLAIPHFVWLLGWSILAFLAAIANGLVALIRGRSALPLHRFLGAYVRYSAHVTAFVCVVANPFPGFVGAPGYPVDIVIGAPERQRRWITLLRTFLVVPALIVGGALWGVLVVVGFLGWFVSLALGRMPSGLRDLGAVAVRYLAQTNAYWFVVTDAYPYASPALLPPPQPEPAPFPEPYHDGSDEPEAA